MARFSAALALLAVLAIETRAFPIHPRPLTKRIAQTTIDAPKKWEDACVRILAFSFPHLPVLIIYSQDAAGGGEQCNPIAVTAAGTLLAAAGACDQQDSGDAMVDLAKQVCVRD